MDEVRYLISDAAKKVDVESHVLRYWEDELELEIPRNEMGHRYYTELHIRLFKQIKELKEKGYQLKAIKNVLNVMLNGGGEENLISGQLPAAQEIYMEPAAGEISVDSEKMEKFQEIMNRVISQALLAGSDSICRNISEEINGRMNREIDYLMQIVDEKEEERFKRLDEILRTYKSTGRGRLESAAALNLPLSLFKKKKMQLKEIFIKKKKR